MGKHTYNILGILLAAVMSLTVFSCNKAPINGKLDGQWQVMSIENADGTVSTPDRHYYCFNLHIAQLTSVGAGGYSANMVYDDSVIALDFPYNKSEQQIKALAAWGIDANPVNLKVVTLTSKKLVMQTATTTITCRKF